MKWFPSAVAAAMLIAGPAAAQQSAAGTVAAPAGAPAGARAIPLYGRNNPGSLADEMSTGTGSDVRNVTYPTLTPVLPKPGTANGSAMIVAPGGGFLFLSMDNEGWRVAQALADRGITAYVLKYRLNPTPRDAEAYKAAVTRLVMGVAGLGPKVELNPADAQKDALAALKLVRTRGREWGIDPARVGMIGFSAGAIATLSTITDAGRDNDPLTTPPSVAGYIYGPMDAVRLPADAPPLFTALAMNDGMFGKDDFAIVNSWRAARRPVELHVYQDGGHGFGLGKPGMTNALMMPQFLAWLEMQGFMKPGGQATRR